MQTKIKGQMENHAYMIVKKGQAKQVPLSHDGNKFKSIIIEKGRVPGLMQLAEASFEAGESVPGHVHESMTEIFHIKKGRISINLKGEVHELSEGDTFVVHAGTLHSLNFLAPTRLIYFSLA